MPKYNLENNVKPCITKEFWENLVLKAYKIQMKVETNLLWFTKQRMSYK